MLSRKFNKVIAIDRSKQNTLDADPKVWSASQLNKLKISDKNAAEATLKFSLEINAGDEIIDW